MVVVVNVTVVVVSVRVVFVSVLVLVEEVVVLEAVSGGLSAGPLPLLLPPSSALPSPEPPLAPLAPLPSSFDKVTVAVVDVSTDVVVVVVDVVVGKHKAGASSAPSGQS